MRFVIQIEVMVISPVRAGPAVMPRSSQKTVSHLVPSPPLGTRLRQPIAFLAPVRVIERASRLVHGQTTSYASPALRRAASRRKRRRVLSRKLSGNL